LNRYFPSIKRYSWVILVCVLLATLIGFVITRVIPPAYQVSSVLLVQSGAPGTTYTGGPTASDNLTKALTYSAQILTRSTMQYIVTTDPRLTQRKYSPNDLLLDVVPTPSTTAPTISILVTAKTSSDAVMIANDVANGFASLIQANAQQQLDTQRKNLQGQLTTYQQQEKTLYGQLSSTPNTDPHYNVYQAQLQDATNSAHGIQAQLLVLPPTASLKGDVAVVQSATPDDVQPGAKALLILAVTAGVGLLLGLLIMFLLIFLDNRLTSEDQVKGKLDLAYLGGISNDKAIQTSGAANSPTTMQEVADICANLRLTGIMPGQWRAPQGAALLVTSNQAAEGKTTIATAIATVLAQSGNNVAVVDGNLRQPSTHLAFGMGTNFGLSELLRGTGRESVDDAVQRTKVPNVWLLTAGTVIANPATLLEQRFPFILAQLRKKVDVVVIDGPALFNGAEASVLASQVDGVALVVDTRVDKVPLLLRSKELLTSLSRTPAGVIMNRLSARRRNRYYAVASPRIANPESRVSVQPYNGYSNGSENGNGQSPSIMIPGPAFVPAAPSRSPLSLPGIVPSRPPMTPLPAPDGSDVAQKPQSPSAQ